MTGACGNCDGLGVFVSDNSTGNCIERCDACRRWPDDFTAGLAMLTLIEVGMGELPPLRPGQLLTHRRARGRYRFVYNPHYGRFQLITPQTPDLGVAWAQRGFEIFFASLLVSMGEELITDELEKFSRWDRHKDLKLWDDSGIPGAIRVEVLDGASMFHWEPGDGTRYELRVSSQRDGELWVLIDPPGLTRGAVLRAGEGLYHRTYLEKKLGIDSEYHARMYTALLNYFFGDRPYALHLLTEWRAERGWAP